MVPEKIVWVYHSVSGSEHPGVEGSFPIPLERLMHQVREARRNGWRFDHVSNIVKPTTQRTVYITADDGTVDWVRNALPWLEEEGIPSYLATITGPWESKPIYPVTHLVQIALVDPEFLPVFPDISDDERAYIDKSYSYETETKRRYTKGLCNLILDDQGARRVLGSPRLNYLEKLAIRFATPGELKQFQMVEFGVHTVSHKGFEGNIQAYLDEEILPCYATILREDLRPSRVFVQPMQARHPAKLEDLVPTLKEIGFIAAFNYFGPWNQESFIIPRTDAKRIEETMGFEPREDVE